jgi:hypothetical protein
VARELARLMEGDLVYERRDREMAFCLLVPAA